MVLSYRAKLGLGIKAKQDKAIKRFCLDDMIFALQQPGRHLVFRCSESGFEGRENYLALVAAFGGWMNDHPQPVNGLIEGLHRFPVWH